MELFFSFFVGKVTAAASLTYFSLSELNHNLKTTILKKTMARSFSNAKALSGFIAEAINRRGYSAVSAPARSGVVSSVAKGSVKKTGEEIVKSTEKVSWVPDPRTGFYRPENLKEQIDVAELRALLLKKN